MRPPRPSQEKESIENLARYIIRASFSQERMTYLPEEPRIICRSKDNRQENGFDPSDCLGAIFQEMGMDYYLERTREILEKLC